jgi:hypothetical protein
MLLLVSPESELAFERLLGTELSESEAMTCLNKELLVFCNF